MRDRSAIYQGMSMTGGAHPVAVGPFSKREGIVPGLFMTSTPNIVTKSAPPSVSAAEIGAALDALTIKLANVLAQLRGGK